MTDNNRLKRMKISRVLYTLLCLYPKTAGLTVGLRGTCGVIGNELTLDCSLEGDTWNAASTRQWKGPPSLSLFIDSGTVQPGIDRYQETIDHVATTSIFSFIILNLTWSDVDKQYQCIYKFSSDQYTINSSLIEDYKSTVANYSEQTKGMDIKAIITLDKITPVPTAEVTLTTTSMKTDVTSQALTIKSTPNGNLTRVEIVVQYAVSDRNDYITVNLTTPCGYSKSFRFTGQSNCSWFILVGWIVGIVMFAVLYVPSGIIIVIGKEGTKQDFIDFIHTMWFWGLAVIGVVISFIVAIIVAVLTVIPEIRQAIGHGILISFGLLVICLCVIGPIIYCLTPKEKVFHGPPLSIKVTQTSVSVNTGELIKVTADADGYPIPNYTWTKGEKEIHKGRTLMINSATLKNAGVYTVAAHNKFGKASRVVAIEVKENNKDDKRHGFRKNSVGPEKQICDKTNSANTDSPRRLPPIPVEEKKEKEKKETAR